MIHLQRLTGCNDSVRNNAKLLFMCFHSIKQNSISNYDKNGACDVVSAVSGMSGFEVTKISGLSRRVSFQPFNSDEGPYFPPPFLFAHAKFSKRGFNMLSSNIIEDSLSSGIMVFFVKVAAYNVWK